jgi:hypothetical protein
MAVFTRSWARSIGLATLALAGSAHAIGIVDAKGDWVPGYSGPTGGDLDVVGAYVTYNVKSDAFVFVATLDDDIGTTAGAFYVWGVNRGAGTARFAGNGIAGVLFDTVVVLNQDGSGAVNRLAGAGAGATPLAAGTAQSFGSTIVVTVAGSLLASNGFAKTDYTWNLWPRAGAPLSGFAAISDFAPDNSNMLVTTVGAVPEPTSALLLAGGLALLALGARRRRAA